MYKKEQFDIAVYYDNISFSKLRLFDILWVFAAVLSVLAVIFFFPNKNVIIGSLTAFAIIIGVLFLRIYFYKKKKHIVLGLNKDGMYLREHGFVSWDDIKDIVIGYDFGYKPKQRVIFFVPHDIEKALSDRSFYSKIIFQLKGNFKDFSEDRAIPGVYEFYLQEPLETVLQEISDYVVNLNK